MLGAEELPVMVVISVYLMPVNFNDKNCSIGRHLGCSTWRSTSPIVWVN